MNLSEQKARRVQTDSAKSSVCRQRRGFLASVVLTSGMVGVGLTARHAALAATPGDEWNAVRVIEARDTRFGRLSVLEVGRKRYLAYGSGPQFVFQSAVDLDRPNELMAPYTRLMMLGMAYATSIGRVAQIGVGAGNMTGYVIRTFDSAVVHAIDIDPHALELGARHFGLAPDPRLHVHVEDGRRWLAMSAERFDVIMLDAYDDQGVPEPLASPDFFRVVASRLARGGVAVQNAFTQQADASKLIAAMRVAFAHVDVYGAEQNRVLFAYQGERRSADALRARARALDARLRPAHPLEPLLALRIAP